MARRPELQIEHRGIAQILERRIAKGRQKQMLDEFVAQLAAAAVAHHDGGIIGQRQRASPVGEIRRARSSAVHGSRISAPGSAEPALRQFFS